MKSDIHKYKKPSVTVDLIIFTVKNNDLKVLLVSRGIDPFKDMWALPGGFVHIDESVEKAAQRELFEETGIKNVYLEQLYTFGDVKRDPRGRVITIAYFALINSAKIELKAKTDAKQAQWYSIYSLPKLAFDHKKILDYALQRLRYKLEYTTAGFQLLPELFTLTELQTMYEIIMDKKFDKRNFRKKIKELKLVEKTSQTKMEGAHRPAALYKFKSKEFILDRDVV